MRRHVLPGLLALAATTMLVVGMHATSPAAIAGPAAPAGAAPAPPGGHGSHPAPPAGGGGSRPPAVDHGADTFQPGYLGGRVVVYRPGAPVAGADVFSLYQIRYPTGWDDLTARPLCNYCDHAGNGKDATDFHDHVLARPDRKANAAGAVTWHVYDVSPAYNGRAGHDRAASRAYARLLPVQSVREVRRLLATKLPDGTPVARVVDTKAEFGGPITSRY